MATTNYIRVTTYTGTEYGNKSQSWYFFFDSKALKATAEAYRKACACQQMHPGSRMAMYAAPQEEGPWDAVSIVGYRPRLQIMHDINSLEAAANDNSSDKYYAELECLDSVFDRRAA